MQTLLRGVVTFIVFILFTATGRAQEPPRLVVVLVVDQMRKDFVDRFDANFEGGFRRLLDNGIQFSNAHQDFWPTNTGPGHATISTGKYPGVSGIVNNSFYDKSVHQEVYCVEDERSEIIGVENDGQLPGRSPRNLMTTGIADWVKKGYKGSRVFSVSKKDRAAVIMGGQKPDGAYWFDNLSGQMISSTYYMKSVPQWVSQFNGKDEIADAIENGWTKFADESVYAGLRPDNFVYETGIFIPEFPHSIERMNRGVPESQRVGAMMTATPMSDKIILNFATKLIEQENLGTDDVPDLLMVSCSAADAIGHHFGPESHEVMDHFLYLDSYLDSFFNYLDDRVGKDKYWVVLASDHGVIPMPEAMKERNVEGARRIPDTYFVGIIDSVESAVQKKFGLESVVIESLLGGVYINYLEVDARGLKRKDVAEMVANELKSQDFIEDAFTSFEIEGKENRGFANTIRRGFVSGKSPDVILIPKENVLIHAQTGTSHGSVYDYDSHVPVVFMIPGLQPKVVNRQVSTADIAPTLAGLLNLKADKKVQGEILEEVK